MHAKLQQYVEALENLKKQVVYGDQEKQKDANILKRRNEEIAHLKEKLQNNYKPLKKAEDRLEMLENSNNIFVNNITVSQTRIDELMKENEILSSDLARMKRADYKDLVEKENLVVMRDFRVQVQAERDLAVEELKRQEKLIRVDYETKLRIFKDEWDHERKLYVDECGRKIQVAEVALQRYIKQAKG